MHVYDGQGQWAIWETRTVSGRAAISLMQVTDLRNQHDAAVAGRFGLWLDR